MNMKLCSDCVHFRRYTHTPDDGSCTHPNVVWIHPVTGAKRQPSAMLQRTSMVTTSCGQEARLWEYDPGSPPDPEDMEDMG